jgi:signal transduction histidine kinase
MPTELISLLPPRRLFAVVLIAVFAAEAAVMLVLPFLLPADRGTNLPAVVDACLLTAVVAPVLWRLVIRPLQQLAAARQRLVGLLLSAQEDERRRIARDLHDGLGQALTSLLVGLRAIEESSSEEKVRTQVRALRDVGAETHDEVRRLARGLRPAVLDDAGFVPALERFLAEIRMTHDVEIGLDMQCPAGRLPADVETALYRIAQEAVTNAVRHSQASRIDVTLNCTGHRIEFAIQDNGRGFDPATSEAAPFGLLSIHERAVLLGGHATIHSQPGAGSKICVSIPLAKGAPR